MCHFFNFMNLRVKFFCTDLVCLNLIVAHTSKGHVVKLILCSKLLDGSL